MIRRLFGGVGRSRTKFPTAEAKWGLGRIGEEESTNHKSLLVDLRFTAFPTRSQSRVMGVVWDGVLLVVGEWRRKVIE